MKHLKACPACAEPRRVAVPQLDEEDAEKNRKAALQVQRTNIKNGLPANHAATPSYKTDIPPTYQKDQQAACEPPIPAPVPKDPLPPLKDVPKPFGGPIRVILHLYSGQRRHENFQPWYERFTDPDDITTYVLSIDIANNATMGDLTN